MLSWRKLAVGGVGLIVWGCIGAIWSYTQDSNSFDYFRISNARELAELHFFIFSGLGTALIGWSMLMRKLGAGHDSSTPGPND